MHVLVDLNRCQSYGQCVYAAPDIFALRHEEILEWHYFVTEGQTTVNSVSSAILTFWRHPDQLDLLRARPELMPGAFEEVLRLEPPITVRDRLTLDAITVEGVTIPQGVTVQLSLAAANRDPTRFADPDRFDPERSDNQHLSFFGGPHYCFGAPLARLEGRIMLTEWLRRVDRPRLLADPPPYRESTTLRGPRHLPVAYEQILP